MKKKINLENNRNQTEKIQLLLNIDRLYEGCEGGEDEIYIYKYEIYFVKIILYLGHELKDITVRYRINEIQWILVKSKYLREANDDDEEITFIIKYGCETNLKKQKQK